MDIIKLMAVLISQPALAVMPAAVFFACFAVTKSKMALIAGVIWFTYCLYEYAMKYRILCSGECNIRIDLFIIYPVLIVAALAALAAVVIGNFKRGNA